MRELVLALICGLLLVGLGGCIDGQEEAPSLDNASARSEQPTSLGAADLQMDGAERARPNASAVVFTWEDEVPADPTRVERRGDNRPVGPTTASSFEVPSGVPFVVDATLTGEADARLALRLNAPNVTGVCVDISDQEASCTVSALPRDASERWEALVEYRGPPREAAEAPPSLEDVPFTATVTLRALDPGLVPDSPTLVPSPDGPADSVDPGWPDPSGSPVRPGTKIDETCTANFLFSTPDNATLYIGTAAHCVSPRPLGAEVPVAGGEITGTVAYCSFGAAEDLLYCPDKADFHDPGWRDDFALVEIPREHRDEVHPAMRTWGGPTTVGDAPSQGTQILTYGNSPRRDGGQDVNVLDSRPGLVTESSEETTRAVYAGPAIGGDSGSPVITMEGATVGTHQFWSNGKSGISNLAQSLSNLEESTGRSVELKTWPLFDVPRAESLTATDEPSWR